MVGAIAILGTLMAITTMPNEKDNGFVRKWMTEVLLTPLAVVRLDEDLSGIVGVSEHSIFLAGNSPTGLLIVNKFSYDKDTLGINLDYPPDKIVPFYMKIDTPKLYLHLNNPHVIISGEFPSAPLTTTEIRTGIFLKSLQINDSIIIIKSPDSTFRYQYLSKFNSTTGKFLKTTLLKDINGTPLPLSHEGILLFDSFSQTIIYLEYYRNKFICMDTSLSVKYDGHTIDTTNSITLQLATEIQNDSINKLIPSEARINVNDAGFVDKGNLLVVSGLRADNQSIKDFNSRQNIDLYRIKDGIYTHSFQIEKKEGKLAKSLFVREDTLYALFPKELRTYKLKVN